MLIGWPTQDPGSFALNLAYSSKPFPLIYAWYPISPSQTAICLQHSSVSTRNRDQQLRFPQEHLINTGQRDLKF